MAVVKEAAVTVAVVLAEAMAEAAVEAAVTAAAETAVAETEAVAHSEVRDTQSQSRAGANQSRCPLVVMASPHHLPPPPSTDHSVH